MIKMLFRRKKMIIETHAAKPHYMELENFAYFLSDDPSIRNVLNLDGHLIKYFSVYPHFDEKNNVLNEVVPIIRYANTEKTGNYLHIKNENGLCTCDFMDVPSNKSNVKTVQIFNIKPYEQTIVQDAVLKAIEENEKKRKASFPM